MNRCPWNAQCTRPHRSASTALATETGVPTGSEHSTFNVQHSTFNGRGGWTLDVERLAGGHHFEQALSPRSQRSGSQLTSKVWRCSLPWGRLSSPLVLDRSCPVRMRGNVWNLPMNLSSAGCGVRNWGQLSSLLVLVLVLVPRPRRFMAGEQVRTEHETSHEPGTAGILAGVAVRAQHAGRDAGGPNDSPVHGRCAGPNGTRNFP